MLVKNTTTNSITFITGQVLAPGEAIDLDDRARVRNEPWITGQLKRGFLVAQSPAEEAEPVPEITRSSIRKMPRSEVAELLEAHGDLRETEGVMIGELRERLIDVMFVDL